GTELPLVRGSTRVWTHRLNVVKDWGPRDGFGGPRSRTTRHSDHFGFREVWKGILRSLAGARRLAVLDDSRFRSHLLRRHYSQSREILLGHDPMRFCPCPYIVIIDPSNG